MTKKFVKLSAIILGSVFIIWLIGWVLGGQTPSPELEPDKSQPIHFR